MTGIEPVTATLLFYPLNYLNFLRVGVEPTTYRVATIFWKTVKPSSHVAYKTEYITALFYTMVLYRNTQQDKLDIFICKRTFSF